MTSSNEQKTEVSKMSDDDNAENVLAEAIRAGRGAQLRALVLSWYVGDTYQRTLQLQAEELQNGDLQISDDWAEIAESILQNFANAQKQQSKGYEAD